MTTVWAVCVAEYESNGPVAVFTTQALAEEHCVTLNASNAEDHEVVPLPLLDAVPQVVTWHHRQCRIRDDGAAEEYEQQPRLGWDYDHDDPAVEVCWPRGAVVVNAWATSPEAARAACDAAAESAVAAPMRCAHCGRASAVQATANGAWVCHTDWKPGAVLAEQDDCYRLVTVYGEPLGQRLTSGRQEP